MAEDANGIPGFVQPIRIGRLQICAGFRAGCESPYCPACSRRSYYNLQRRLLRVTRTITPQRFRWATFTAADCSDSELRATVKIVAQCARDMFRQIPSLEGWFMRPEASASGPARYHPHIHALLHVKPGYHSGRNCMSSAKWRAAWSAALPEPLHSVQSVPVLIKRVDDVNRLVRYLCKSPWHRAHLGTIDEKIESVIRINEQIRAMAGLRRYACFGSLACARSRKRRTPAAQRDVITEGSSLTSGSL